jgi:hypothetical protein
MSTFRGMKKLAHGLNQGQMNSSHHYKLRAFFLRLSPSSCAWEFKSIFVAKI